MMNSKPHLLKFTLSSKGLTAKIIAHLLSHQKLRYPCQKITAQLQHSQFAKNGLTCLFRVIFNSIDKHKQTFVVAYNAKQTEHIS